jgi:hypothetical protein
LLFKFCFRVEVLISASQGSELTLLSSPWLKGKIFSIGFTQGIDESPGPEALSTGLQRALNWDSVHLQNVSAKTTFA